jgi:hypothetical protein
MGIFMAERQATFLYKESKTLFFEVDGDICGFMSDSLSSSDDFVKVVETLQTKEGSVPLSFVSRNAVLITPPNKENKIFSESYKRLTVHDEVPVRETTKHFLAGFRIGDERGYTRGFAEAQRLHDKGDHDGKRNEDSK